ncbi:MAG: phosphopantothenoylcysteine decarboxylase [Candidatus Altiarchaeota archaeon]
MKVLITLGPTQEPLDSVRYITNASSGRMGKCLAEEAIKRNFSTTIVSGPVNLNLPEKAKIFHVRTAEQMIRRTILELKKGYDILISAAAIGDFTPVKVKEGKIKSEKEIQLTLKPTPKLTKIAKEKFPEIFVVGFKAEYKPSREELIKKGFEKLISENLDLVIANDLSESIGSKSCEVYLIDKKEVEYLPLNAKEIIAKKIWDKVLDMLSKNESGKFRNIK